MSNLIHSLRACALAGPRAVRRSNRSGHDPARNAAPEGAASVFLRDLWALPAHALIVHVAVVFIPLAVLAAISLLSVPAGHPPPRVVDRGRARCDCPSRGLGGPPVRQRVPQLLDIALARVVSSSIRSIRIKSYGIPDVAPDHRTRCGHRFPDGVLCDPVSTGVQLDGFGCFCFAAAGHRLGDGRRHGRLSALVTAYYVFKTGDTGARAIHPALP